MSLSYRHTLKNATVHQVKTLGIGAKLLTGFQLTPAIGGHSHTAFFIDDVMPVQISYFYDRPWLEQITRMRLMTEQFHATKGCCVPLFNGRFSDWDEARWEEDTPAAFFEEQLFTPSFDNIDEWEVTAYFVYGVPYLVLNQRQRPAQCPFAVFDVERMQAIVSDYNASVIPSSRITSDTPGFHQLLATVAP
jgi:hypothetical protein